jgi:hypothetical protein
VRTCAAAIAADKSSAPSAGGGWSVGSVIAPWQRDAVMKMTVAVEQLDTASAFAFAPPGGGGSPTLAPTASPTGVTRAWRCLTGAACSSRVARRASARTQR